MALWIDKKYAKLLGSHLTLFKEKKDGTYNFKCPVCGDSKTNHTKCRGYIYQRNQSLFFKCHNCQSTMTLGKFIKFVNTELYKVYVLESIKEGEPEPVEEIEETPQGIMIDDILEAGAVKAVTVDEAMSYIVSRHIPQAHYKNLYYIDDMEKLAKINTAYLGRLGNEARLIIPFVNKNGTLSGVSGRALGQSTRRYINIRFTNDPMVYGINDVKLNERGYTCEGPFDSMFLHNCLGAGGTDLYKAANMFYKESVLIYDNQPRNKEVIKIMERAIWRGYSLVIWPRDWKYKDINEAIVDGVSQKEVQELIYKNTFSGLKLKLAIRDWKKL